MGPKVLFSSFRIKSCADLSENARTKETTGGAEALRGKKTLTSS